MIARTAIGMPCGHEKPKALSPVGVAARAAGIARKAVSYLLLRSDIYKSLKRALARKKLEQLVQANRDSFAIQDYAKRRAAAKKGCGR